jgi:toxin-antitoxin system PIN domain toxin
LTEPVGEAVLVDVNLLMWAHHAQMPQHAQAREWWARALSATPLVGIPWPTIVAFVRLSTHPRVVARPLAVDTAWGTVAGWLERPNVRSPAPTERHAALFHGFLLSGRASGDHVPDAHLAALAVEWGLELLSADRDFARYPGLRWRDPLAD